MVKILLDSSFILTCVKQKIDFLDYLQAAGYEILVPEQVIAELENINKSKEKLKFKDAASMALRLIKMHKITLIDLKIKNVDKGIIEYAGKNSGLVVATLDQEIKKSLRGKNKILIIRGKKELEVLG